MNKVLKNQNGQGIMEYLIITSLIGIFCLVTMKHFGEVIERRVDDMKKHITTHINLRH